MEIQRQLLIQCRDVEAVLDSVWRCGGCCGISVEMYRLFAVLCDVDSVVDSVWRCGGCWFLLLFVRVLSAKRGAVSTVLITLVCLCPGTKL